MQAVQLTQILSEILQTQSRVVLPGLGIFYAVEVPARLRPYAGTLKPAHREVFFEKGEFPDDGLLRGRLSEECSLAEEEAAALIRTWVGEWNTLLLKNRYVELPGFGTLYFGPRSSLKFKLKEGLVMPSVLGSPTAGPEQVSSAVPPLQEQSTVEASGSALRKRSLFAKGKYWFLISAIILIGGSIYLIFSTRKTEQTPIWSNLEQKMPVQDTLVKADTLRDTAKTVTTAPVQESPKAAQTQSAASEKRLAPKNEAKTGEKEKRKIYIVSGQSLSKESALRQQKILKRHGIRTSLLQLKAGKYYLSLGQYRNREEAEGALKRQKKKSATARIIEL